MSQTGYSFFGFSRCARRRSAMLRQLIGEALKGNPEIAAAAHEREAAGHRGSPAGALYDSNAVSVEPGKTGELIRQFTKAGMAGSRVVRR